ncbi:hypothetical protein [Hymenobacter guriensis]|uniref:Uncharacterized protein n=1 Tax=Hymenobacter guriensis TaxID=2793065 RepID=A0ABS0L3F0_9BACT|nr:hypothetical protein [Hymenobacter guriensis]MBG8554666.1 hypothetical protein [Hymenobacter guriensis]
MTDSPDLSQEPPGPRSEADILADPRLREWLASYQPLFHELFLRNYATLLQQLHTHGKQYEKDLEYLLHQHEEPAAEHLWLIQHQKLFDLECQWRAGLVTVPGAQLTSNFEDWHDHIRACPVLTPISPEELALFDAFLAQLTDPDELSDSHLSSDFWLHRRYRSLRTRAQDPDEADDLTEWTQFWDLHRGTGYLRSLPDVRGDLEFHYEKASRKPAKATPAPAPPDPRPQVPTYGPEYNQLVRELLRRYEPARLLRQFEARQQLTAYDAAEDSLTLPLALERLQNAGPGLVPIQAHADWRQAIIQAANRHYLDQLRAALPQVYEAYRQRETLGIAHPTPDDDAPHSPHPDEFFNEQKKRILKGRRQLGEPENLDF